MATPRKNSAVSLLKNENSDDDEADEATPILKSNIASSLKDLKPNRPVVDGEESGPSKRARVASALRKISNIGAVPPNANDPNTHAFAGQVDDGSYSFEKTILFGRYRNNDDPLSFRRKSGMAVITPVSGSTDLYDTDAGKKKWNQLRSLFKRDSTKAVSQTNILDSDIFDDEYYFEKKKKSSFFPTRLRRIAKFVLEDWLFLALLGVIMALLSFGMDWAIDFLQEEHQMLMDMIERKHISGAVVAMYFLWISYTIILVAGSALFAHYVAPQAIGSGIPEMKTILRGVILKEYLTFRTLISKVVGLTFSLGSGLPIGKEGPFVHVASVVANLLSHLVHSFNGAYANESRSSEMLAAGCAVGVACTFSAPVGGVLFSIEVTSVYFAVRNYWRGFFAAICAATIFRLLRVYTSESVTVVAFYQTNFPRDSFLPSELPIFALIGLLCGLLSAAFIYIQRNMVLFLRRNKFAKSVFQKYWLVYPMLVALVVASLTFPNGFGKYIGGEIRFSKTAKDFFQNCTFTEKNVNSSVYCSDAVREHWYAGGSSSPFVTLSTFLVVFYFLAAIASTVPIPSGIFGPSFVIGGCIGRLIGEFVAHLWQRSDISIYPGVYSVVGAAAFCGGVTHTVSVAVIVFELTGQLVYILPVMIAVLIANAVCSYLQPSIYDSIIRIKHLPYLPDIPHSSSNFHGIRVEQFMTPNVRYLSRDSTYAELQELLINMPRLKAFPIVEDNSQRILIGSCSRAKLLTILNNQVGPDARQREANRRIRNAIADVDRRFRLADRQRSSFRERRPSIFDHLDEDKNKTEERRTSVPSIVKDAKVTKGSNFDYYLDKPVVDNMKQRSKSTCDDNRVDKPVQSEKHRTQSTTTNRFTVVPVPSEPVPGTRSGGRRGALSADELMVDDSDTNSTHKLSDNSVTTTESIKGKPSSNSIISAMVTGLKRDRPKSIHGTHPHSITRSSSGHDVYHTIGGMIRTLTKMSLGRMKHKGANEDYDLSGDERREWEVNQLAKKVNFDEIGVDPAPFQLVEHSSLFKVHSLFSLLGLNRAYVTKCGKLVGVVALKDLRIAIEKVQAGLLFANSPPLYEQEKQRNSIHFEGAHLVGVMNNPDDDNDDDVQNDRLNPRLEVISRVSSQYGNINDGPSLPPLQVDVKASTLQVPTRHLSVSSDPCIAIKVNEASKSEDVDVEAGQTPSGDKTFLVQPVFEISPSPSPVPTSNKPLEPLVVQTNEDSLTPPSRESSNSTSSSSSSTPGKKKSRHVQILVPPTPDHKKNKDVFDFTPDDNE